MSSRAPDLAVENATILPREPHCELLDTATHEVWLSREPTPRDEYARLDPPAPLVKSGHGSGGMDRAWFRRSPGAAEDGPLRTREIGGRVFQLVARPELGGVRGGYPRRLLVHKHHVIAFAPGRTIPLLRGADGKDHVQLVTGRGELVLPAGWSLRELTLGAEWVLELPCPTETWWFANGASFQGPVEAP